MLTSEKVNLNQGSLDRMDIDKKMFKSLSSFLYPSTNNNGAINAMTSLCDLDRKCSVFFLLSTSKHQQVPFDLTLNHAYQIKEKRKTLTTKDLN